MNFTEKQVSEKVAYEGNFLKILNVDVILPDGNKANRDIIRHPGASAVLPINENGEVILVRQWRTPLNKTLLEVPAGKLEKGEDPLVCAERELEEETGFKASKLEYMGSIATVPGFCDEIIHLYLATGITSGVKGGDEDEFTEVEMVTIDEMKAMIKSGEIIDTKTINCLCHYMLK